MQPRAYQDRGVQFWLDNPRCYFAIDMGLGKTLITLLSLVKLGLPTLIIAPLRTVYTTWPEEIEKWNIPLSYSIVHGKGKVKALTKKVDVYLTNFESIPFVYDSMVELHKNKTPFPFSACVIDEGSMIKSHSTKRFKYLDSLRGLFPKYRAILSGTPAPNSLMDLWAQYYFLTDGEALGDNFFKFRRKYYTSESWNPYQFYIKQGAAADIQKRIAPYTFRLDERDHLELPEITYSYLPVKLTDKLMKQYNELKKEFLLELNDVVHTALSTATLSMKLRQFLQGFLYYEAEDGERKANPTHNAKLTRLKELIDESSSPVLCAIQFRHEIEMIRSKFPDAPVIASGVKASTAARIIEKWNKGEIPLLLCHPASMAHGVNMQYGGSTVVWFCTTWSLEHYLQLNKRLHRSGQKKGVVVHHIVVKGTIDDKVTQALSRKMSSQQELLDFLRDETNY